MSVDTADQLQKVTSVAHELPSLRRIVAAELEASSGIVRRWRDYLGQGASALASSAEIGAEIDARSRDTTPDDIALLVLPLHHVHGIVNVLGCALAAGASCEILPQFDAERAWDRLASGEITVFSAVPTIYHRLIASYDAATPAVQRARRDGSRRVRLMMSGSAALPVRSSFSWQPPCKRTEFKACCSLRCSRD